MAPAPFPISPFLRALTLPAASLGTWGSVPVVTLSLGPDASQPQSLPILLISVQCN